MLERKKFKSDLGKELWDKFFGFLDKEAESAAITPHYQNHSSKPAKQRLPTIKKRELLTVNNPIEEEYLPLPVEEHFPAETSSHFLEKNEFQSIMKENEQKDVSVPNASEPVNLAEIIRYFKNNHVVGEEDILVAATLALVNGSSFGIEGYSGSGKTFLADTLLKLVQEEVYTVGLSSNLALFNDSAKINSKRIIYIPELQKAMKSRNSAIIEAVKDLTEGKDARRLVSRNNGQGTIEYTLRKGVSVVYTLALENRFNPDEESSRRFIRLQTDNSPEHIQKIHRYKVNNRTTITRESEEAELEQRISAHLRVCMDLEVKVLDPFAGYISGLVPKTQKSVGYVDHYYSLLDACAKFHHQERVGFNVDGQDYLLLDLEDHLTIFQVYFKDFISSLQQQSHDNEEELFICPINPDWQQCYQEGLKVAYNNQNLTETVPDYGKIVQKWESRQTGLLP